MLMIFDKDGVIFDTEPAKTKSYWLALEELARLAGKQILDIAGESWDEARYREWHTKKCTGGKRLEVINLITAQFSGMLNETILPRREELKNTLSTHSCGDSEGDKEIKKDLINPDFSSDEQRVFSALRLKLYYEIPLAERARPIESTICLMKMVIRAGDRIALITESKYARTVQEIEQLIPRGLNLDCFCVVACKDGVYVEDQKMAEGGEKQEMYERIMSLTACEPKQCLVVEDTDKGQAAALAAGLTCFKVSFPGVS